MMAPTGINRNTEGNNFEVDSMAMDLNTITPFEGQQVVASFEKKGGRIRREVGRLQVMPDGLRVRIIKGSEDDFRLISVSRLVDIQQSS